jgi:hypothetical protein
MADDTANEKTSLRTAFHGFKTDIPILEIEGYLPEGGDDQSLREGIAEVLALKPQTPSGTRRTRLFSA